MRMRSCDPPSCRTCRGERLSSLGTFALHVRPSLTPFTQLSIWRISPVIHRGEKLAGQRGGHDFDDFRAHFTFGFAFRFRDRGSSVRTAYSTCCYARHCHWPHTARRRCSRGGAAGTNLERITRRDATIAGRRGLAASLCGGMSKIPRIHIS
jgi:hypothetical protein